MSDKEDGNTTGSEANGKGEPSKNFTFEEEDAERARYKIRKKLATVKTKDTKSTNAILSSINKAKEKETLRPTERAILQAQVKDFLAESKRNAEQKVNLCDDLVNL